MTKRSPRLTQIEGEIAVLQQKRAALHAKIAVINDRIELLYKDHAHLLVQVLAERDREKADG